LIHRAGRARGQDLKKKIPLPISWKSLNTKYQIAAEPGNVTNGGTIGAGAIALGCDQFCRPRVCRPRAKASPEE
jgi:hypothetical protein